MKRQKIHDLKTWLEPFSAILRGDKKAEYRLNDRDFKVGDSLNLQEWNEEKEEYTGRSILADITHIVEGGKFGIPESYCVMTIMPIGIDANSFIKGLRALGETLKGEGVDLDDLIPERDK